MFSKNWNIEKGPGKTGHWFLFKYPKTKFLLVILIFQWIPDDKDWGIAKDIKMKKISLQKNGNKVRTILKAEM